ncbi:hypothetical protein TKK_0012295 [Trichogramma kaykai]|uniref:Major facilitator superfamily (MFS) profile domain-containing protein n=1 Tax=Trichogramma kaykai TaxID=54128 RepID=A0ABD2WND4_9HYME
MLSTWRSCCLNVPQRWLFVYMSFIAVMIGNSIRVILSITITSMVYPLHEIHTYIDNTCQGPHQTVVKNITSSVDTIYNWDEYTQGIILSSYFWGYAATQIPFGRLAERLGGKYIFGMSIFVPSILTFLMPIGIEWGESTALIVLRMLMGVASGAMFPACSTLISYWSAPEERTKMCTIIFAGAIAGTILGTTMPAVIIRYSGYGWPAVFYWFGIIGMAWFPFWIFFCYNSPEEHPFIMQQELDYLRESLKQQKSKKSSSAPWASILKSKEVWAFVVALCGCDWAYFTVATDLPKYMSSVVKFSIEDNGYLSSLPYLSMWIGSFFCSWLLDKIVKKQCVSLTNARKGFAAISLMGPGVFLVAASYAECNQMLVVVMFVLGLTFMSAAYPSIMVNNLDLSPNFAGTLMAFANGIAALGGILTPYVVGILTPHQTIGEWRFVFWIVFGVATCATVYVLIFTSTEVQSWNEPHMVDNDLEKNVSEKEYECANKIDEEIVR